MNSSPATPPPPPDTSLHALPDPKTEKAAGDVSIFGGTRLFGALLVVFFIAAPFVFHMTLASYSFTLMTFLEVVVLFNILIIVHELGHFLAAKWCGLTIDKFAIWFGKPLWSKKVDGVEYILGSVPAGGYVALPQMAPMEAIEGKTETPREDLPPASPWQKIIVAFAGPLFSFGLALVFATLVWVVGKPVTDSEATSTIGYVLPDSPAGRAGLLAGDKILFIDGHPITRFSGIGDSVMWRIVTSTAPTIPIEVERDGKDVTLQVTPEVKPHAFYQRSVPRRIGIAPAQVPLIVKTVLPYSPVAVAGIVPGDRIVALNGAKLYADDPIFRQLKDHPNDPLRLTVVHQGASRDVTVTPAKPVAPAQMPKDMPETDIGIDEWQSDIRIVHQDPLAQVGESVEAIVGTIGALFTPHSTVGPSQLSGPLGIMNIFFSVLSGPDGWRLALWLAVVINVNLALINLLPLPVLDGGHIMLSLVEWVRRRPLSMKILEPLQTACALLLIGYILYITFFDVQDSGKIAMSLGGDTQIRFAPKPGGP